MLIEIDGSAIDDVRAGAARSHDALENLLHAHVAGRHVVWIDRAPLGALAQASASFSARAQGALRTLRAQENEIRGLRERMRCVVRAGVGAAYPADGTVVQGGRQSFIDIDLRHFHDDERSGRTVLLGEHQDNDALLYETLAKAFAAAGLRGWRVEASFDRRHGGGGTTPAVLAHLVGEGRLVLAIVDSDRKFPGGQLGGTATSVQRVPRTALQGVHVIHVRAGENLITSAVYREAFMDPQGNLTRASQQAKLDALGALQRAEAMPSPHAWRDHAELKHGVRLFALRALPPGSAEEAFWSGVAVDLQRHACWQPASCAAQDDCRCYVADALGRDALELAVAWLAPRDPRRNAKLLALSPGTALADLCEKIVAWGLALPARRA